MRDKHSVSGEDLNSRAARREERELEKAARREERELEKTARREERAQEKAARAEEKERKRQEEAPLSAEERFDNFRHTYDPDVEKERAYDQELIRRFQSFIRTEYAKISLYVILTCVILYLLSKLGDHFPRLLLAAGSGIHQIGTVLTPLIWGFVAAYLLYPLMKFLSEQLSRIKPLAKTPGRTRGIAVGLTVVLAIGAIVLILSVAMSAVGHQIRMVSIEDFGNFISDLATSINDIYKQMQQRLEEASVSSAELEQVTDYLSGMLRSISSYLVRSLTDALAALPGIIGNLPFTIIFAIYFLLDTDGLTAYWDRVLRSLSSRRFYRAVHLILDDADMVFAGYIRGQMIDALIMFALVSVALTLLNVQYAVIIGIMTGIGNLIPYVGPFIAYGCTVFACLLTGDWKKLVISVIVLFVIQTVDGNVINPRLLSNSINVHPMLVIVALIVGGGAGGIIGMLIAVPVAALIKIWFDRLVSVLLERKDRKRAV